jgi:predicted nucleic acid-binding protein
MLIYLDACAIIEAREKPTPAGRALANLIVKASGTSTLLTTSELSLVEVLVEPLRGLVDRAALEEDPESREYHDWYVGNLVPDSSLIRSIALEVPILKQAALLRARVKSLRAPDAIHIASAIFVKCSHFITGDGRLVRAIERDTAWSVKPRFQFVELKADALDNLATAVSE